jgi:hypothetical protein
MPNALRPRLRVVRTAALVIALAPPSAALAQTSAPVETLDRTLAALAADPTIQEVQEEALRLAALEPRRTRRLLTRVRWAGLLPEVEASLSRGLARDEDLDRAYQDLDELSLATDEDLDFGLSVTWDLDRLIYDPEELRAHREVATQAQRRRELLMAVTRLYYELLLLRAEERAGGEADAGARLEGLVRMAELRALLDGLTGGLYSRGDRTR